MENGKENQRIMLTKRILKEALLKLLKKKTVDKVTVTELCKEADINRATFYRHYSIPLDVLVEIEEDLTAKIQKSLAPLTTDDYENFILAFCKELYQNADIIKVLIKNKSDEYLSRMINEFYKSLVDRRNATNDLEDLDEESLMLISSYVAGGGYFMLLRWITEGMKKTPEEMASLILIFVNKLI